MATHSPSQCPERQQLQAFLLGTLSAPVAQTVEIHVGQCQTCKVVLAKLSATTRSASQVKRPSPKPNAAPMPTRALGSPTPKSSRYPFLSPPQAADELGRLGDYRVLRLLGEGGMGYVFQAEDIALHRPVALKVMKPDLGNDVRAWDRFLREARTMASVKHEHFVTVFQVKREGDVVYFAMELLQGESLDDRLKRPLAVSEILRIGQEIAGGLAFIQRSDLIHRDLKPANIWLEAPQGRVKILDLGLARPVEDDSRLTQSGMVVGTPAFMSPEQARGEPLDGRSDLFSLGCVLYTMCTGMEPFRGNTVMALLTALAVDTPEPIHKLNPEIPRALSDLVAQLLAKQPGERPASAEAVREHLEEIERRPQAPVPDPTPVTRGKKSGKRARKSGDKLRKPPGIFVSRRMLAAGLAVAVLGVIGLYFLLPLLAPPRPPEPRSMQWPEPPETDKKSRIDMPPPGPEPAKSTKVFLSDLKTIEVENWPWRDEFPVRVQGKASPHGIFMHAPPPFGGKVSLSYRLGKQYRLFHAQVSLNDGPPRSEAPMTFTVYGDGKELWSKEVLSQGDGEARVLAVQGVEVLKIEMRSQGHRGTHAVWIEPAVEP